MVCSAVRRHYIYTLEKNAGDNTYRYMCVVKLYSQVLLFRDYYYFFLTIFLKVKYFCSEYLLHTKSFYIHVCTMYLGYLNTHHIYSFFFSPNDFLIFLPTRIQYNVIITYVMANTYALQ